MSDAREVEAVVEQQGALRHPSGWWKARDGKWYRPDQAPATDTAARSGDETGDLVNALSIAVGAVVLGSLASPHLDLTLLIGGIAGALVARWHLFSRAHRGLLMAVTALCAGASSVLVLDVARASHANIQLQRSVLVATTGALMATMMAAMLAVKLRAVHPRP